MINNSCCSYLFSFSERSGSKKAKIEESVEINFNDKDSEEISKTIIDCSVSPSEDMTNKTSEVDQQKERPNFSEINPFVEEELCRLEQEKKLFEVNENVVFYTEGRKVMTQLSFESFKRNMNSIYLEKENHLIKDVPCRDQGSFIFRKKFSNRRKRDEVKVYFDDQRIKLGQGAFGVVRKIVRVGSDQRKTLKESVSSLPFKGGVVPNLEIENEGKALNLLHESLPHDRNMGDNKRSLKHLGLQDSFRIGGKNSKEQQVLIGTYYTGDGGSLKIQGAREALVVCFQLLFGLRVLEFLGHFTHDIKPKNTLYERSPGFCLPIKISFSDINSVHRDEIYRQYQSRQENLKLPFGICTRKYINESDLHLVEDLLKQLVNHDPKSEEFKALVTQIFKIRSKSMVSLTAQTIFNVITKCHYNKFIEKSPKKGKVFTDTLVGNLIEAIFANKSPNEKLCRELACLIVKMTSCQYEKRPTAKQALSEFLKITKEHDLELHGLIVKNGWTDGYANWKN